MMKKYRWQRPLSGYLPIHMPHNTGAGFMMAALSFVFGFAMIWYMWLLAIVAFVALLLVAIGHTFNYDREYYIPADEVSRIEQSRTDLLASHV
jgi:cytochrome o ubiquinol oxidase subunit 1